MLDITAILAVRATAPDTPKAAAPQDAAGFAQSLDRVRRSEPQKAAHLPNKAESRRTDSAPVEKASESGRPDEAAANAVSEDTADADLEAPEAGANIPPGHGAGDLASLLFSLQMPPANAPQANAEALPILETVPDGIAVPGQQGTQDLGLPLIMPSDTGSSGTAPVAFPDGVTASQTTHAQTVSPETSVGAIDGPPIAPASTEQTASAIQLLADRPAVPEKSTVPAGSSPAAQAMVAGNGDTPFTAIHSEPARDASTGVQTDMPASPLEARADGPHRELAVSEAGSMDTLAIQLPPTAGAPDGPRQAEAPRDVRLPPQPPVHIVVREGSYDNLGLHVARSSRDGEEKTIIRLDPPRLGTVELTLETRGEVTRVVLVAERPEALDMLRRDAQSLEQSLTRAGLKMEGGMEFSLRQDPRGSDGGRDGRDSNREQKHPAYGDDDQELIAPLTRPARSGLEMIV
ncbi:flagellar hook-length control protein FliK [Azospirillum sp. SYSU D00513]|uniref:flagellar hook-length control protein FliK n=1 Tax=Azospirillum sp. SYSU D00513 TaxID=2812561 RepID=UPI001A95AFC7|nr:flagellar hook-length control protein FliK [Azospirillum sp. SYSU D00513]